MKSYSLKPTDENAIEMFRSDAIGRNKDIFRFINLIDAIDNDDCCSIALNGEWGSGKTFFIKQVKLIMDFFNELSDMDNDTRQAIKSALASHNPQCNTSYATVYYDAWKNDNNEDPILSLIYAAMKSNQANIKPNKKKNISEVVAAIADVVTGRSVAELLETAKGEDLFENIRKEEDIQKLVEGFITSLIEERANQVVIFIDELDRCKPIYAIQLLERIKHYFNDDRIIFIFSVSLSQLQHTIKCYYGTDFDATRYLDKFFDLRVCLPEINYDYYLEQRFPFVMSSYIYNRTCVETIKYFRFSLRETERFIRLIKIAAYKKTQTVSGGGFSHEKAYDFALIYLIPIIIGLNMIDTTAYVRFITGVDSGPLYEIFLRSSSTFRRAMILNTNECFSEEEKGKESDKIISLEDRLNDVYSALFGNAFNQSGHELRVGPLEISLKLRDDIFKIVALLSPISDYNFE